jgi:roadblock/LC7 domain-containing protein
MALSVGLLAVITLVLVGMYGGVSFSPGGPADGQVITADVTGGLQKAEPLVGFPVVIPASLPSNWTPNSFTFTEKPGTTGQPPAARAGWLTPEGRFVTLVQSSGAVTDVLTSELGAAAPATGTVQAGGQTWTTTTGRRSEQAWFRTVGDVTYLITGSAPADDFSTLAAQVTSTS